MQVRDQKLSDWLARVNARALAIIQGPNGSMITFYSIGRSVALVQSYGNGQGWDIYVPASTDNRIDETLKAAETVLGV